MSLSADEIREIVDALQASDWNQATVSIGDVRIAVARNGHSLPGDTAVATTTAPAAPTVTAPTPPPVAAPVTPAVTPPTGTPPAVPVAESGHVITAPSVGVFWRAPQPGAAPFVEIGSLVQPGDTIGIVEVMKLMSNIAADVAGEVVAIHVENSGTVQFGAPLVTIRVASQA